MLTGNYCRSEDRFLLGTGNEVVSGRGGIERSHPTRREAQCVAKPGYVVHLVLMQLTIPMFIYHPLSYFRWSNEALTATGFIWVRYSLVITPVNYSLAAVSLRTPCVFH